ncbi:adenylyltransferase/cytidyltransferase family protein [Spongiibacter taiwanensis]|uniref:adenylyltransferase/cytidyltransferase family protein n=1 Tax=Spongiibacter taiwanensis TaxID=1748242 RepID=UPI002034DD24|nr:adenylyltransferase/cytidyltransferase family protein [Spongiibacter taiwanensis]USA44258.1 adenylyltransferase/cytidyltransferase family protein [Spongiibacter taiwanensis]
MSKVVITFGTFDVFHVGHLRILEKARALGSRLVVGVSTDELSFKKKRRAPVYSQDERYEIVSALKYVDECFFEERLEDKGLYISRYKAGLLVMGNDWQGKFDNYREFCEVVYLPRTESISTTAIIEKIQG